ncbi:diphthine--ammonia ligase [Melioribacteraceae bacterium 4301-Me]|uniref:Dph6-related ATP pyrophosphatase n=1 Tax=Pyranulibacter aquaticus TaxID=3163344 RepID=UPI00359954B9
MKNAVFNWSGGKDSALCLYYCLKEKNVKVQYLLTTVNKVFKRVSMHGVRIELLEAQAKSIGVELKEIFLPENPTLKVYNNIMKKKLIGLKKQGIDYSVYGDIFLEDLRQYREQKLSEVSMKGLFPLWGRSTTELIKEFIELGFKAIIVCVNEKYLNKTFAGKVIDYSLLNELPSNVDPCGENGEFHSFVFDGPIFNKPINFSIGDLVYKKYESKNKKENTNFDGGFWYRDLLMNI